MFWGLLWIPLGLCCLVTLMLWFNPLSWPVDVFSHFRPHYTVLLLGGLVVHGLLYPNKLFRGLGAILLSLCLIMNLVHVWPYVHPQPTEASAATIKHKPFSVLHLNLLFLNRNLDAVTQLVHSTDADIISLAELTPWWENHLLTPGLKQHYPYQAIAPYPGQLGLLSKYPLKNTLIKPADQKTSKSIIQAQHYAAREFLIVSQVQTPQTCLTVLASHPAIPLRRDWWAHQHVMHQQWKAALSAYPKSPRLVLGDFNSTPFSVWYPQILQDLHVMDTMTLSGWQPSWPAIIPLMNIPVPPFYGIAIDQILISPEIQLLDRHTGPNVGSDHLPVLAKLALPKPVAAACQVNTLLNKQ